MTPQIKRLNLQRDPILRAIYDAVQAIELCGASDKLTDAVIATTRLSEMAATLLDERDAAKADLAAARVELRNIATADPSTWDEDMRDQFQSGIEGRAMTTALSLPLSSIVWHPTADDPPPNGVTVLIVDEDDYVWIGFKGVDSWYDATDNRPMPAPRWWCHFPEAPQ